MDNKNKIKKYTDHMAIVLIKKLAELSVLISWDSGKESIKKIKKFIVEIINDDRKTAYYFYKMTQSKEDDYKEYYGLDSPFKNLIHPARCAYYMKDFLFVEDMVGWIKKELNKNMYFQVNKDGSIEIGSFFYMFAFKFKHEDMGVYLLNVFEKFVRECIDKCNKSGLYPQVKQK